MPGDIDNLYKAKTLTLRAQAIAFVMKSEKDFNTVVRLLSTARKLVQEAIGVDLPPPAHYAKAPDVKKSDLAFYMPDKKLKRNDLEAIIEQAANYVGVDKSWAKSDALHKLIEEESGGIPSRKNEEGSSAFGLFQMMPRTWNAFVKESPMTNNAFWQSVGGLRYIKKVYKTPERAQQFREAVLAGDETLAPVDLQAKASKWISKGYKGY